MRSEVVGIISYIVSKPPSFFLASDLLFSLLLFSLREAFSTFFYFFFFCLPGRAGCTLSPRLFFSSAPGLGAGFAPSFFSTGLLGAGASSSLISNRSVCGFGGRLGTGGRSAASISGRASSCFLMSSKNPSPSFV